jgi:uncharacterized membrane protein
MPKPPSRITTEARWPVIIAVVGLGGSTLALPDPLVLGPRWFFPVVVGVLLVTTLIAHRARHHEFDTVLGYAISVIVTLALVTSLVLLLTSLASKSEPPAVLLRSGAVLWVTNILVFALWYWRLDAGGPHEREARGDHTAGAFFFPQMMDGAPIGDSATWIPNFIDYLFLAFNTSTAFSPTDVPVMSRWAKVLSMVQSLISLLCIAVLVSRAIGLL